MTRMQLRNTVIALIIAVGHSAAAQAGAHTSPTTRKIDSLLARMTLEEKLGQLNLLSFDDRSGAAQLDLVRRGVGGGVLQPARPPAAPRGAAPPPGGMPPPTS